MLRRRYNSAVATLLLTCAPSLPPSLPPSIIALLCLAVWRVGRCCRGDVPRAHAWRSAPRAGPISSSSAARRSTLFLSPLFLSPLFLSPPLLLSSTLASPLPRFLASSLHPSLPLFLSSSLPRSLFLLPLSLFLPLPLFLSLLLSLPPFLSCSFPSQRQRQWQRMPTPSQRRRQGMTQSGGAGGG